MGGIACGRNAPLASEIALTSKLRPAATKMCDWPEIALPGKAVMVYGCCRRLMHVVQKWDQF
jgi:outer membrane protein assembly factor BamD